MSAVINRLSLIAVFNIAMLILSTRDESDCRARDYEKLVLSNLRVATRWLDTTVGDVSPKRQQRNMRRQSRQVSFLIGWK